MNESEKREAAWGCFSNTDSDTDSDDESIVVQEKRRDSSNGVLSFHFGVEEQLLYAVESNESTKNSVEKTLAACDKFCMERHWMMHVGDEKGEILLSAALRSPLPFRGVELGTYCGYSTTLLSKALQTEDSWLLSIEKNPKCLTFATRMLDHAGCNKDGRIEISLLTDDNSPASLINLKRPKSFADGEPFVTFLFIDHEKGRYLEDLLAIEPYLVEGAIVVADNITSFDQGKSLEPYIQHVRSTDGPYVSSTSFSAAVEYSREERDSWPDSVEVSVYGGRGRKR
eukprot:g2717.t1